MSTIPCPLVNMIYMCMGGRYGDVDENNLGDWFQPKINYAVKRCVKGNWPLWHNGLYYYEGKYPGAPAIDRNTFEFRRASGYKK